MKKKYRILALALIVIQFSCKKFLDIGTPANSLVDETVFKSNDQAIAALNGIYSSLTLAASHASGSSSSITCYGGLSSDELKGYSALVPFSENRLTPTVSNVTELYRNLYRTIYTSNAILEGVKGSTGLSNEVKNILIGEAYFNRSLSYFYLMNFFGDVPLQLSTDYRISQLAVKAPVDKIYNLIIDDLKISEELLLEAYPTTGRGRPNKSAVQCLLSRIYLYKKDWANAELYATKVINKSEIYSLETLDRVFINNSREAILQLVPQANSNTREAQLFILRAAPQSVSLREDFATRAFEANDKRKDAWVKSLSVGATTYYFPYKYKALPGTPVTEYSIIMRLAELYLIRAEAKINQDNIASGISDLNILRKRSLGASGDVNPISALQSDMSKLNAILAVEQERKVELFCEWGHRWLDLKRTGRGLTVLSLIKPSLNARDLLYPIPFDEITMNPKIIQNDGY